MPDKYPKFSDFSEEEAENDAAKKFNEWLNTSEYAQWIREDWEEKTQRNERAI